MAFVHPVLGTVAILISVYLMSRGLVARQGTKASTKARRTHKRWAWWSFGAMVLALVTGLGSTVFLRDDLELGDTLHLEIGIGVVAVMGVGGLLTRYFTRSPRLRWWHPWIGVVAVIGAIVQGIFGIELLP